MMLMKTPNIPKEAFDYQPKGACAQPGIPDDIDFFSIYERDQRRAKTICNICPVKEECLDFALKYKEPDGIWGGMTYKERLAHHRRQVKMRLKESRRLN